jgi:hypothetical protein
MMATPASRATSVMVGPEWRRLAAFRGGGTNLPSYAMPVTAGQSALSEQERITGLWRLNNPVERLTLTQPPPTQEKSYLRYWN